MKLILQVFSTKNLHFQGWRGFKNFVAGQAYGGKKMAEHITVK